MIKLWTSDEPSSVHKEARIPWMLHTAVFLRVQGVPEPLCLLMQASTAHAKLPLESLLQRRGAGGWNHLTVNQTLENTKHSFPMGVF